MNILGVSCFYHDAAAALLQDGLAILQEAGMDWAMLGVDTENLTGALRIYKGAGFRPVRKYVGFRKTMRA